MGSAEVRFRKQEGHQLGYQRNVSEFSMTEDLLSNIKSVPAGPVPVPIEAGIQFDLTADSTFGAVLLTEKPITHELCYGGQKPWDDWVQKNAEKLFDDYK